MRTDTLPNRLNRQAVGCSILIVSYVYIVGSGLLAARVGERPGPTIIKTGGASGYIFREIGPQPGAAILQSGLLLRRPNYDVGISIQAGGRPIYAQPNSRRPLAKCPSRNAKSPTGALGSIGRSCFLGDRRMWSEVSPGASMSPTVTVALFRTAGASRKPDGDWRGVGNFHTASLTS